LQSLHGKFRRVVEGLVDWVKDVTINRRLIVRAEGILRVNPLGVGGEAIIYVGLYSTLAVCVFFILFGCVCL
jgi:hypothetical protein